MLLQNQLRKDTYSENSAKDILEHTYSLHPRGQPLTMHHPHDQIVRPRYKQLV